MVFLFGVTGYVGSAFFQYLLERKVPVRGFSRKEVNLLHREALWRLLQESKPEFIINAAGYTGKPNVDACEDHKAECLLGNVAIPAVLKEVCGELGLPWGHVSSGCIYTGSKAETFIGPVGFREEDPPNFSFRQNNCSFYSGTKALAEEILADAPLCYLWRLRIPFDSVDHPKNYLSKLLRYPKLVDVRNSLSYLREYVAACWACWEKRLPFGTFNVTNPGSVTTREVVELILESPLGPKLVQSGKRFEFFSSEEEFYREAARTPRSNCVLDSSKILQHGVFLSDVREALAKALRSWRWKGEWRLGEEP
ncbi:sugar nucleotide-binding protein [Candidatus Methylacidithermus pantelleriae]|uniref:dTDP-4-dehydrorhamnose reductase n=1 Tax=Candidatus Methylacidithermus pantelleriae TaxID=2744239 RepID=A0A8J2BQS7_9BACT|nr:sugar nucleotide-binding protein [Candidatus Methylacidithermus pantelleriae]CAF0689553.1 dTDP-4-dehydrorhamnose reductase [Candidatus Methylacidithermus pantelleriae]